MSKPGILSLGVAAGGLLPGGYGIAEADFQRIAGEAKSGCPVLRALAGVPITLEASLA